MGKKLTLAELQINAQFMREVSKDLTRTLEARENAKKKLRKLQSRIANRERYDAMRSLGLTKTPYGWE